MPCVKPNEQLSAVPCPMEKSTAFWLEMQGTVLGSGMLMLSQEALQSLAGQVNIRRAIYEAGLTA